jgi:hypothetical protein
MAVVNTTKKSGLSVSFVDTFIKGYSSLGSGGTGFMRFASESTHLV